MMAWRSHATVPPNTLPDNYARQQYARYLYVMMMLFADTKYQWSGEAGITVGEETGVIDP